MKCPKCHFDHPQQTSECLKCGVIFAKYLAMHPVAVGADDVAPGAHDAAAAVAPAPTSSGKVQWPKPSVATRTGAAPEEILAERRAHTEFLCRIYALPAALLLGWLINLAMPSLGAFLEMWCHESGHAVAAWLTGHPALPTAWITLIGQRARWTAVVLGSGLIAGGYFAYRMERWFWVAISGVALLLLIAGNVQTEFHAQMLITFWGEGGGFVMSTVLVMTFYARPTSPMTRNQLRWALLVVGAVAFWFAYWRWAGGFERIANFLEDTDERGPSDMMQLTTLYGWSIYTLVHRYRDLGNACLVAMAGAYAAGLLHKDKLKEYFEQVRT